MNCAQVLIEGMLAMGARRVYGVIGTSNVAFMDALYDYRETMRYISCRHEQVAASMADAEGRLTGVPGVVVTHSGPGTLNALISIGNALKDCSPLICLSGAIKRKLKGSDGMLEADHRRIFAPLCKGVFRIEDAGKAQAVFSQAYAMAMSDARGPVLIEVPEDVWLEQTEEEAPRFHLRPEHPPALHIEDVWHCLEMLAQARRPLILAGAGVAYAGCSDLLVKLIEEMQVPVVTTGNGRGTVPENHPLCFGRVGFAGNALADIPLQEADLVLGLGCTISDMTTYEYTMPLQGEVILVNIDLTAMLSSHYRASLTIEADVKDFLLEALQGRKGAPAAAGHEWLGRLEKAREEWRAAWGAATTSDKTPLAPGRVLRELGEMLPDRHIVTAGAGLHQLYTVCFLPCLSPLSWLCSVNFGSMGFGFPAALAAGLVHPELPVVAVLGDGEFMMTLQDLETAVRENIGVKVLVINDGMYRVLNFRQRTQFQGRVIGTCHGNPDFAALARSFGARGLRLEKPEQIQPVLEEMLKAEGPVVVDVIADPDDIPPLNFEANLRMSLGWSTGG
jgi:acetolactate synthase-1/2/3 large subunit